MKIMKNLKTFLDGSKTLSTMRLVSLSMVWTACLYVIAAFLTNEIIVVVNAWYILHGIKDAKLDLISIDWYGAAAFAGAGLAGKATQSFAENKITKPIETKPVEKSTEIIPDDQR